MSRSMGHTACDCGGDLVVTSDAMTGAMIERCAGCGYAGPARPRMDLPSRLVPPSDCRTSTSATHLCIDNCGRATRTPRAIRCRECDREHERALAAYRMGVARGSTPRQRVEVCLDCKVKPPATRNALRCADCAIKRQRVQMANRRKAS